MTVPLLWLPGILHLLGRIAARKYHTVGYVVVCSLQNASHHTLLELYVLYCS
jgi:hypothetical protein